MHYKRFLLISLLLLISSIALIACGGSAPAAPANDNTTAAGGDVSADGSSTVGPITQAVAEEFRRVAPRVNVAVGVSGTGGGFKKFCPGETDISDASRPIKDSEKDLCADNGVEWTEFMVGLDGLTVMVNPANDFLECLSVDELTSLLREDSTITTWADLDPDYPAEEIQFFIPDPDSGTRDYMIEVVQEATGVEDIDLRQDQNTTFATDDNVLLDGIANNQYAFGFFGFAYYVNNTDAVKAVAIQNEAGDCVLPASDTVQDGSYNPLSRPLFIYVNNESARTRSAVADFLKFFFSPDGAPAIMNDVGYSMPPDGTYEDNLARLEELLGQ